MKTSGYFSALKPRRINIFCHDCTGNPHVPEPPAPESGVPHLLLISYINFRLFGNHNLPKLLLILLDIVT